MDQPVTTGQLGRPFWTVAATSALSNLADGVLRFALPLLAVRYTLSPALIAGIELARSAPWLVISLQAGALADRLDRRRTMLVANSARFGLVGAATVAVALGWGELWVLYMIAIGTGVAEVFYDTAAQSLLPSVVHTDNLDRANGRLFAVEVGAQQFIGPPLAGVLVAVAALVALAAPAALWLVAVLGLVRLHGSFRPAEREPASLRADIGVGLGFVAGHPVLRILAVMVGGSNLATSATGAVLVLFAVGSESTLGLTDPQFGLLFAISAVGAIGGGMVAERVQAVLGAQRSLLASVLGMIGFVAAPAVTTEVWLLAVMFFTGSGAMMIWNVITVSYRQRVTPDHLLGRVNSTYRLVAWGTMPIGAALGGGLGEWLGVRSVFAIMGLASLALLVPVRHLTDEALLADS